MPNKVMIALVGRARSGKDTFYSILKSIKPDYVRLSFAAELKVLVAKTLDITVEELEAQMEN